MRQSQTPKAIFDSIQYVRENRNYYRSLIAPQHQQDFSIALDFLLEYVGSKATYNAYRRELEKLMQWTWLIAEKSITELDNINIEEYINFCIHPPLTWVATKNVTRFILAEDGRRAPNKAWRPFTAKQSKEATRLGMNVTIKDYCLSQASIKEIFSILNSFYNYLIQRDIITANPVSRIRQKKTKFLTVDQAPARIVRRLSELQWEYLVEAAKEVAEDEDKDEHERTPHERTLFMIKALYAMYLRISELVESDRWKPKMSDFYRDPDGLWWFRTIGKGNKAREISVSDSMLKALKRWRKHLKLSPYPSPSDNSPLLPKTKGTGGLSDTRHVRAIIQQCFDLARSRLEQDGLHEEASVMANATVHWLRHTGISEDVKFRPREHVRDDAGHSSGAITDRYIDIEKRERNLSAKKKKITEKDDDE